MRDDSCASSLQTASPFPSIDRKAQRRIGRMHVAADRTCENARCMGLRQAGLEDSFHRTSFVAQSANGSDVHRPAARSEASRLTRPMQTRRVPLSIILGAAFMLQLHSASSYLIKSHLYWERVGAFPHYLTEPPGLQGGAWPKSSLCYNGPSCAKNTPDYRCNPDCGNPDIALTNDVAYPKAYLIRFVSIDPISEPKPSFICKRVRIALFYVVSKLGRVIHLTSTLVCNFLVITLFR